MKARYNFIGVLALSSLTAFSQISITEADMPSAGDTLNFSNGFDFGLDLDDTGPDHVWDFGNTWPLSMDADTFVTVGSTPFLYQFFFNNFLLYPDHDATMAVRGEELELGDTSFEDIYEYFKDDDGEFQNVGFGARVNGLPLSIRRQPVDRVYRFPLEYGDIDTSYSNFEIEVPLVGYYGQSQWRYNEVDGWGTITTPAGTFDALRVRSTLDITDTVYIETLNFGFTVPRPESVEYKWLAPGHGIPVFQVNTAFGVPVSIRYKDGVDISTDLEAQVQPNFRVYPNPATSGRNVRLQDVPQDALQLDVFNMQGQLLRSYPAVDLYQAMDMSELGSGQFLLRLSTPDQVYNSSLVLVR